LTSNFYGQDIEFKGCECNGFNFYGMPSLQFIYTNAYTGVTEDDYMQFSFEPYEYLLFPLIDSDLRVTHCDNSIWNIATQDFEFSNPNRESLVNDFSQYADAFGQVFMRKYGMYITYQEDGTVVFASDIGE
jgi:hypothetical protein